MQLIITKLENENSHLHKKVQDISMKNDEKDREISELKYLNEKDDF
jgi:hypothetical protein